MVPLRATKTYYSWSVLLQENSDSLPFVQFRITISERKTEKASFTCDLNKETLYIVVDVVVPDENGLIFRNSPVEQLRDISMDQLLAKLKWEKVK